MDLRKILQGLGIPVFLLLSIVALAQDRMVTGRITDASGNGIPGVSVTVKGTNRGTTTDATGSYRLSVPANGVLVLSSVGYTSKEVTVAGNSLNETLQTATSNLNEVVVIGYGTARKRDLTGSVASVTSKDFQKGTITTPEQLIAGKVPGVQITSSGGRPGAANTIRIRGGSSLNASNDPLIVVDGVPLDQGSIRGVANPLSMINPNDIESFTVLKDASAAAIYGSRAANGVILIQTKKGRSGALKINFSTNNSISAITKKVDLLTGDQVRSIVSAQGNALHKSQVGTANTDWQDVIYRKAYASDNNISLTGGIKGLPYRFTLGYLTQTGILKTDKLQRASAAISLNPTFLDNHLKVDLNLKGTLQETRFANTDAIGAALNFDPTQPIYSNDKRFGGYFEWREATGDLMLNRTNNPLGLLEETNNTAKPKRSIGNIQFDYKFHFLPELRANLNLGYDISKTDETKIQADSAAVNYRQSGLYQQFKQEKKNTLLDFYLNYVKELASIRSRIDLTAGYSFSNFWTKNYNYRSLKANKDTIPGTSPETFPFDIPENTLISYFGRLNYSLLDKYLLTATVRRDGSSRFIKENRWGTFPSLALAWNIKREDFLKSSSLFNDLKLRLGWGVTGQQEGIANYDYTQRYGLGNGYNAYQFGNSFIQTYSPIAFNKSLRWEETTTWNAGIDYSFAGGRVSGSVDYYVKNTDHLLNSVPQPGATNFSAFILANVGSMQNKGVEFNLTVQPVRNQDVSWDINFNATYNKNTITNLTVVPDDPNYIGIPTEGADAVNGFVQLHAVGGPRNTFYLYRQVYDDKGNPIEGLFEDINRDGIINDKDRYKGFSAAPNWFFGLSSNVTVKNWTAGFVARANLNNYVYNNIYSNRGRLNQVLGTYTLGNASTNYLSSRFAGSVDIQPLSDYYLENGSFIKLDNLYVGYNFGKINHSRVGLRVNAAIQNVFTITKYTGLDPEQGNGIDQTIYPRPRTYTLGINLDF